MAGIKQSLDGNGTTELTGSDGAARVNLPWNTSAGVAVGGGVAKAGFAANAGESDQGTITGNRDVKALEMTSNFRLRVASDITEYNETFVGSAINSSMWTAPVTTSTISVATNLVTLNNAASLASGAVARISTYRYFPVIATYPLYLSMHVQFSSTPVANMVHEWGAVIHTGTAAPTDGAYFTINATGEFRCVVNTGGTVNQSPVLNYNLVGTNTVHEFLIYVQQDVITFWIDNIKVYEATLTTVAAQGLQLASGSLPISFRSYNSGTVTGTAQLMKISMVNVTRAEMVNTKPWTDIQAGAGKIAAQGQTGGTLGSTALYTNSLAAGAGAALTNTTAATGSGLGGQFSVQPTLTANTDGILQSYQNPAASATALGSTLYIKGVSLQGLVTTAFTGGPVYYAISIAFGHNSVSLATTASTTAKAPVRKPIGFDNYVVTAPVGTVGQLITKKFDVPIPVYPGEFVQIVVKNLGTVTSAGVITYLIDFDAYND